MLQRQNHSLEEKSELDIQTSNEKERCSWTLRQKFIFFLQQNNQILLEKKYLIYELIHKNQTTDTFRTINIKTNTQVFTKFIYKNQFFQRRQHQQKIKIKSNYNKYEETLRKIHLQNYLQSKLLLKVQAYFVNKCDQIYQNQDFIIKICQQYDQTLEEIIIKRNCIPIDQALAILKQIMFGLTGFVKEGIILSQINPNCIVFKDGAYKINQLTCFKKVSQKFSSFSTSQQYDSIIAPQLVIFPQVTDIKSQIWALGILFYKMIAGSIQYQKRENHIYQLIRHSQGSLIINDLSFQAVSFLQQLLMIDPMQRISWKNLMNHPIFQNGQPFYNLKLIPLIDLRTTSMKMIEKLTLEEQAQSQKIYTACWYQKISSKIINIHKTDFFQTVSTINNIIPKNIINPQTSIYKKLEQINLMNLKAEYIYNQIVLKLVDNKLISQKKRNHIEMVYLLMFRCSKYIESVKSLQNRILKQSRLMNYIQQIKLLNSNIQIKFIQYQNKLKKKDNSTFSLSKDVILFITNHKNFNQKINFFKGRQGHQFNRQQQIQFTQQQYLNKFVEQLKNDTNIKIEIKKRMVCYSKINSLEIQQIRNYSNFYEAANSIITMRSEMNPQSLS